MTFRIHFLLIGVLAGGVCAPAPAASVDYNRSVRPILSDKCYKCHGPDAAERRAGLRLDVREEALKTLRSKRAAIVPGKAEQSALVDRVFASDPDEVMPPPDTKKILTQQEKQTLRQWIAEGASFDRHWAFQPLRKPSLPTEDGVDIEKTWPRNDIDRYVLRRLRSEGLAPGPEAARSTLVRRLSLDLTGLPPSPAAVDAFLSDNRSNAYEELVNELLDSPAYGERMALDWLDAARFADTHGYHIDSGRDMTRWREWVIDSFNRNTPFDQFTVDQLAGDLLPNSTLDQRIASGFHRNHMINFEGGAIPDEYHTAYIVDRVNTTATVWLGLTVACTQCHDHKYDPLTQKEFYQLFAFFHNVPENGLDGSKGNAPPLIQAPTSEETARIVQLTAGLHELEAAFNGPLPMEDAAQEEWEHRVAKEQSPGWVSLDADSVASAGGATLAKLEDLSIRATGQNPAADTYTVVAKAPPGAPITAIRVEALADDALPARGPGRSLNGNFVLTQVRAWSGTAQNPVETPLRFRAASADFSQKDYPASAAIGSEPGTGWAIHPEVGKPHFAVFELDSPLASTRETYCKVELEFRSRFGQHQLGRFRLSATSSASPHATSSLPVELTRSLALARGQRSVEQAKLVREYFRSNASEKGKELRAKLDAARKALADAEGKVRTAMVMQEMEKPRDTFVLLRGQYDKKGEKVQADVPAVLPPLPDGAPRNRLGLARWLVDRRNPLTARVIVNRYWQMYFGTGIVKTAEDFGSQGEPPTHPDLLDWLASTFVETGWDVKALQRSIVTSATYRQSSVVTPALLEKDPENRLLSRGPRLRLQAELLRDQALCVSGLLDRRIGGASVSPYQPAGLWEELMSREDGANWTAQTYKQSHGPDLYRRTLYTFWKRTSPPPTLVTFDAPDRESCTVRRARTNTPLQALILMNDPTYIEASRKLAERLLKSDATVDARIALLFRLCTGRRPEPKELQVLEKLLEERLEAYRRDHSAALKLLGVGEAERDRGLSPAEVAAWTLVASAVLNLDETVTKG